MTRIIGGTVGGQRIAAPRGVHTRPTTDRVREALFSAIESWCGSLEGLRFLDLYAGSGAVGIEARSRGAGVVTLVESDRRTATLVAANVRKVGLNRAEVISATVEQFLLRVPRAPYDVVFLDPPYPVTNAEVEGILGNLVQNGWLAEGALVVVERASRGERFTWPAGIEEWREKKYGETLLGYGRAARASAQDHGTPSDGDARE
ncbi:16S rRNA (guanine(966)-N(2))-methyltransferase RsmD [Nocardioides sp. AE5]|uniref:16S rRNA (guanine(966)-N(2))-methyltransferase RsmD n=1 Tax=Nocardioides sp. AE5 TaxID=2962573 RepID=UPI00288272BF|nr:16S rRNA (guanine(966)-N(2))-methyltransferase RsmD [Nocardioides sp. AE5]MDT0202906.1 16S rRNA (guanine(966)-N(2))-methyltransferase RsmD [Nocardioides sp. AE5]